MITHDIDESSLDKNLWSLLRIIVELSSDKTSHLESLIGFRG